MLTHHQVTGIAHLDDGSYQVTTPPITFKANTVVLAAGSWSLTPMVPNFARDALLKKYQLSSSK